MGNLVRAIEAVYEIGQEDEEYSSSSIVIDWKQAFRDLSKLMSKIKALILKKGNLFIICLNITVIYSASFSRISRSKERIGTHWKPNLSPTSIINDT